MLEDVSLEGGVLQLCLNVRMDQCGFRSVDSALLAAQEHPCPCLVLWAYIDRQLTVCKSNSFNTGSVFSHLKWCIWAAIGMLAAYLSSSGRREIEND